MDKLNEALSVLVDLLKSTKDFVGDQAPKVAQEIVAMTYMEAIVDSIFLVVLIGVCVFFIRKINAYCRRENEFEPYFASVILSIVSLFTLCGLACKVETMVKCKYAPRVVILDYVSSKVKGESK
jgi:hypothetical protein